MDRRVSFRVRDPYWNIHHAYTVQRGETKLAFQPPRASFDGGHLALAILELEGPIIEPVRVISADREPDTGRQSSRGALVPMIAEYKSIEEWLSGL